MDCSVTGFIRWVVPNTDHSHYFCKSRKTNITMKAINCAVLALVCIFGLVVADFGYGASYVPYYGGYGSGYGGAGSSIGNGGILMLFGLFFLLTLLFRNNSAVSTGVTMVNLTG